MCKNLLWVPRGKWIEGNEERREGCQVTADLEVGGQGAGFRPLGLGYVLGVRSMGPANGLGVVSGGDEGNSSQDAPSDLLKKRRLGMGRLEGEMKNSALVPSSLRCLYAFQWRNSVGASFLTG